MAILTPMESLKSIDFSTIIFPYSVTSTAWLLNVWTPCLWSYQWDQDALWHSPSSPNPSSLSSKLLIEWRKQKKKNKNTQWDNTLHRGIKIFGLHFSLLTNLSKCPSTFSSVQSLSRVWLFVTPWRTARQASLSITNSQSSPKRSCPWVGDDIQPSHPLSSSSPPTLNLSQHQGHFKWFSSSHEVAKVLDLEPQHQSFQWTPRTDLLSDGLLDLLAVQGTLKSLLQYHGSKASILWCSAFIVQLSHLHTTTGETIALTRRTFVDKVMSLLFNMLLL